MKRKEVHRVRQGHRLLLYQMHIAAVRRALVNDRHVQHMIGSRPCWAGCFYADTDIVGGTLL